MMVKINFNSATYTYICMFYTKAIIGGGWEVISRQIQLQVFWYTHYTTEAGDRLCMKAR